MLLYNVSDKLLAAFKSVDRNFSILNICDTGSAYFSVGGLKVRVSDHIKVHRNADSFDIDIVRPLRCRAYLASMNDTVFYVQASVADIKALLRSESLRKRMFHRDEMPQHNPALLAAQKEMRARKLAESCQDPALLSLYGKYESIKNIREYAKNGSEYGNIISCAYKIAGANYQPGDSALYKGMQASFSELVDFVKLKMRTNPNSLHPIH